MLNPNEYMNRLFDGISELKKMAVESSGENQIRLFAKAHALETAADLWNSFGKGKALADYLDDYRRALESNVAKTTGGTRQGFDLARDYLRMFGI